MKKILTFNGVYKPGYKGGGPVKSISKMSQLLTDKVSFKVVCADRDYGDEDSYQNIVPNCWTKIDHEEVYYHTGSPSFTMLSKVINNTDYNVIYLNGYFSLYTIFVLLLIKFKKIKEPEKLIISPRGDFTEGKSNSILKFLKKKLYIFISKLTIVPKDVEWHTTSKEESSVTKSLFGNKHKIHEVSNLSFVREEINFNKLSKNKNNLKICYISRITPKKNLAYILEVLRDLPNNLDIEFNIYGPIFDNQYWDKCKLLIKELPSNVKTFYNGSVEPNRIGEILREHHLMFFPTFGENYGHIIVESLVNGCPILISNNTPWQTVENLNIGYIIDLEKKREFNEAIIKMASLEQEQSNVMRENANKYVYNLINNDEIKNQYIKLFNMGT